MKKVFILLIILLSCFSLFSAITNDTSFPTPSAKSGTLLYDKDGNYITFSTPSSSGNIFYDISQNGDGYENFYYQYNNNKGILLKKSNTSLKIKYDNNGKSSEKEFKYDLKLPLPSVKVKDNKYNVKVTIEDFENIYPNNTQIYCSRYKDDDGKDYFERVEYNINNNGDATFSVTPLSDKIKIRLDNEDFLSSSVLSKSTDKKFPLDGEKVPYLDNAYYFSFGGYVFEVIFTKDEYTYSTQDDYKNDKNYVEGFSRLDEAFPVYSDFDSLSSSIYSLNSNLNVTSYFEDENTAFYPSYKGWGRKNVSSSHLILCRRYFMGNEEKLPLPSLDSITYEGGKANIVVNNYKEDDSPKGFIFVYSEDDNNNWKMFSYPTEESIWKANEDTTYKLKAIAPGYKDSDEVKFVVEKGDKLPSPSFEQSEKDGVVTFSLIENDKLPYNFDVYYKTSNSNTWKKGNYGEDKRFSFNRRSEDYSVSFIASHLGYADSDEVTFSIPKYTKMEEIPTGSSSPYTEGAFIVNSSGYVAEVIVTSSLYDQDTQNRYIYDSNYKEGFRRFDEALPDIFKGDSTYPEGSFAYNMSSYASRFNNQYALWFYNKSSSYSYYTGTYNYSNDFIAVGKYSNYRKESTSNGAQLVLCKLLSSPSSTLNPLPLPEVGDIDYSVEGKGYFEIENLSDYPDGYSIYITNGDSKVWRKINENDLSLYKGNEDTTYKVKVVVPSYVDSDCAQFVIKKGEELPTPVLSLENIDGGYSKIVISNIAEYPGSRVISYSFDSEEEEYTLEGYQNSLIVYREKDDCIVNLKISADGFISGEDAKITIPKFTSPSEIPTGTSSPYNDGAIIINEEGYTLEILETSNKYNYYTQDDYTEDPGYVDGFRRLDEVLPSYFDGNGNVTSGSLTDKIFSYLRTDDGVVSNYYLNRSWVYYTIASKSNRNWKNVESSYSYPLLLSRLLSTSEDGKTLQTPIFNDIVYENAKAVLTLQNEGLYPREFTIEVRDGSGNYSYFNSSSLTLYKGEKDETYSIKVISPGYINSEEVVVNVEKGDELPSPVLSIVEKDDGYSVVTIDNYSQYPEGTSFKCYLNNKETFSTGSSSFNVLRIKKNSVKTVATHQGYSKSKSSNVVVSTELSGVSVKSGEESFMTDGAYFINEQGYILEFKLSSKSVNSYDEYVSLLKEEEKNGWTSYQEWCDKNGFYATGNGNRTVGNKKGWADYGIVVKDDDNSIQIAIEDTIKKNKTSLSYNKSCGPIVGYFDRDNFCYLWCSYSGEMYAVDWYNSYYDHRVVLVRSL